MRIPSPLLVLTCLAPMVCAPSAAHAQSDRQDEAFVVIKAARVITLAGPEQPRGEIVLADGKIRLAGTDLEYPKSAKVIDAHGEVVMPGLILPRTRWQLPAYSRSGVHGDQGAAQEVFLEEIDFQPLLEAGFTAVCFYPAGTGVSGPAAIYRTAGRTESRAMGTAYLRITMSSPGRDKQVLRQAIDNARKEIEKVEQARKAWEEKQKKAQEEAAKKKPAEPAGKPEDEKKTEPGKEQDGKEKPKSQIPNPKSQIPNPEPAAQQKQEPEKFVPPKIDPAVQPLVDWIRDKKGPALLFELASASDLRHLDDVLERSPEIPRTLFYLERSSAADYHHVVADLGSRKTLVLAHPLLGELPYTATRYNLPAELVAAGCSLVLLPQVDAASELKYVRNRLASLVRTGLPREEALKAVTLGAAKVLGIQDRLGSIEKGKDADLIFLDGDPLAPETRVTRVMIGGEIVWEAPKRP